MILDGAFVAQILSPVTLDTFQDYGNSVFLPYNFGQLHNVRRLDIVWDVYLADSLVNVVRCYLWHHYLPPGRAS